jgi:hypothetical protein
MADLIDVPQWEGVYQMETSDLVLGGPGGPSNAQAQALADRTAWLRERVDELGRRTLLVPGAAWNPVNNGGSSGTSAAVAGKPMGQWLESVVNGHQFDGTCSVDLTGRAPLGATVTSIEALVKPGASRATTGNRMAVSVLRHTMDWVTPGTTLLTGSPSGIDDGTSNAQVIQLTGAALPFEVTESLVMYGRVQWGSDAATSRDVLYALRLILATP